MENEAIVRKPVIMLKKQFNDKITDKGDKTIENEQPMA